jgi:ankyrin repeat protein
MQEMSLKINTWAKNPAKPEMNVITSSKTPTLPNAYQKWLNHELTNAAWYGRNAEISRLIKLGADIAATDNDGKTALNNAARWGNIQTCALILIEYAKACGDIKKLISEENIYDNPALYIVSKNKYTQTT